MVDEVDDLHLPHTHRSTAPPQLSEGAISPSVRSVKWHHAQASGTALELRVNITLPHMNVTLKNTDGHVCEAGLVVRATVRILGCSTWL